jgi:hypothetical protein
MLIAINIGKVCYLYSIHNLGSFAIADVMFLVVPSFHALKKMPE